MLETSERLEPTRYYNDLNGAQRLNDLNGLNRVGFRGLGPLEPLEPALLSVGEVAEAPLPRSDKILQWDDKLGMRVRKLGDKSLQRTEEVSAVPNVKIETLVPVVLVRTKIVKATFPRFENSRNVETTNWLRLSDICFFIPLRNSAGMGMRKRLGLLHTFQRFNLRQEARGRIFRYALRDSG